MNIRIDDDLAKRAVKIAKNNGISTAKYLNGLVESALNGEDQRAKAQTLEEKRYKAADQAWENYRFPKGITIEASNGWEVLSTFLGSAHFTKVFYYSLKSKRLPTSFKGAFKVAFEDASARPGYIVAYDEGGHPL